MAFGSFNRVGVVTQTVTTTQTVDKNQGLGGYLDGLNAADSLECSRDIAGRVDNIREAVGDVAELRFLMENL